MPMHVRERTEGKRIGKRAIVELEKGRVPAWLVREKREGSTTIEEAIRAYGHIRAIPFSAALRTAMCMRGARV